MRFQGCITRKERLNKLPFEEGDGNLLLLDAQIMNFIFLHVLDLESQESEYCSSRGLFMQLRVRTTDYSSYYDIDYDSLILSQVH